MQIPIYRNQIYKERWIDTSYLRIDGKEEFRERAKYGNRHAIFEKGSQIGYVHIDKFNATDVPSGAINHTSNYVEEKTGIPQGLATLGIAALGLFVGYKAYKWAEKNL